MKPFRAPRKRGETTQVTVHRKDNSQRFKDMEKWMNKNLTGEEKESSPAKARATDKGSPAQQPILDSEEPTELGLVWPAQPTNNPWWPAEPSNGKDVMEQSPRGNGKDVIELSPKGKDVMEQESPRLSDYESGGFIARRAKHCL